MARRSFLAELNRAIQTSAREAERVQRRREREEQAALRTAEQRRKQEASLRQQAAKASTAERKRLEKEAEEAAAAAHLEARLAEVEDLNAHLEESYAEIDGLLLATLSVDNHVDLESLKQEVKHPPFERADLEQPNPAPAKPEPPQMPALIEPSGPTGLRGLVGKWGHAKRLEQARRLHEADCVEWEKTRRRLEAEHATALVAHVRSEEERLVQLEAERARYARECEAREAEILEHNAAVDKLAADLGYGVVEAVEEYVTIVMSNSVFPDHFPVSTEFQFDPANAELRARAVVPGPDQVPSIKAYKYTKSSDEISGSQLSRKACKDRYASAVHQVAIRILHEVFEADRRGIIQAIALEVGTDTVHPATGLSTYLPFVAVASAREIFLKFDLSSVVPLATLGHLGAAVSKNPYELVPIDPTGVRKA
jgi:restriction system protein